MWKQQQQQQQNNHITLRYCWRAPMKTEADARLQFLSVMWSFGKILLHKL